MGAKQRAQKRGKASRGSQKGTPASQKKLNSSMHVPDLSPKTRRDALLGWQDFALSSSPSDRKEFTMGDAARHTERHIHGWGSLRLRDQGISFINAGTLHQDPQHVKATEQQERDEKLSEQENESQNPEPVATFKNTLSVPVTKIDDAPPSGPIATEPSSRPEPADFRPRSTSSSSSEAEQIVFRGRTKGSTSNFASAIGSKKSSRVQSTVRNDTVREDPAPKFNGPKMTEVMSSSTQKLADKLETGVSSSDQRVKNSRVKRGGRGRRRQSDIDEQEAIMRDYIANMVMDDSEDSGTDQQLQQPAQQPQPSVNGRKNETFRFYDGSGEENVKVKMKSITTPFRRSVTQAIDWNSDELRDFDGLSTSDEEVIEISQVLRCRQRKSGSQYLITPSGQEHSDAKWILREKLISPSAQKEIAIFEEIQAMGLGESFDEDEDDEDDDDAEDDDITDAEIEEALNDLIDHIESEDDENARIMKHTAKMTDEQIARALAKQEELGLGGDELVLFSGDIDGDEDSIEKDFVEDAFGRNDDFISFSLQQHTSNRTRSKRNKKNRDSFPPAAAFADALDEDPYGGFDIMDFDRPSLRPKKKGRRSDFPYDLELEDDDLRDQLVATWTNDRDKKAQRKREKEEARQAALFEIADRSEPAAIKAEIRQFLLQSVDILRLSPMESATRASVHRLAKALRLNSHSEGKEGVGKGRYPVLTKTPRTPTYTIETVWEIDALLNTRKFFPKNAGSYKKDKLPRGIARTAKMKGSGSVQGASYMNGEVVGASAPEIGAENRGRAMLEKMGWTTGMAIGAEGNKGSLEAVKHVFKTSRAGLG